MLFQTTMWSTIARARAGSPDALGSLLTRYRAPILEYLRQQGLSEADAEDVTQEVFLQVCRDGFLDKADKAKGRFRTLLLRVTQHVLASEFRKRYAQKRGGARPAIPIEEIQETVVAPEEEDRFNAAWARNLIALGFERLKKESARVKAPYLEALVMRYLEDRPYAEIAAKLGCKESDVNNYLYLGKIRLKKHLADLASEYSSSPEEHEEEIELLKKYAQ
jgi:RNA polymerase sigma-70 factor (ECF subfamily)